MPPKETHNFLEGTEISAGKKMFRENALLTPKGGSGGVKAGGKDRSCLQWQRLHSRQKEPRIQGSPVENGREKGHEEYPKGEGGSIRT